MVLEDDGSVNDVFEGTEAFTLLVKEREVLEFGSEEFKINFSYFSLFASTEATSSTYELSRMAVCVPHLSLEGFVTLWN